MIFIRNSLNRPALRRIIFDTPGQAPWSFFLAPRAPLQAHTGAKPGCQLSRLVEALSQSAIASIYDTRGRPAWTSE